MNSSRDRPCAGNEGLAQRREGGPCVIFLIFSFMIILVLSCILASCDFAMFLLHVFDGYRMTGPK